MMTECVFCTTITLTLGLQGIILIQVEAYMDNKKYYQIDEVAKITELTKRTIRYYEDMELLMPKRTDAGYRLYTDEDIDVIIEIRNLTAKVGLNFAQVRRFMGLKKNLTDILEEKEKDPESMEDAIIKVKDLMEIVDEKEAILKRIRNNCNNYLEKLNDAKDRSEGKNEK